MKAKELNVDIVVNSVGRMLAAHGITGKWDADNGVVIIVSNSKDRFIYDLRGGDDYFYPLIWEWVQQEIEMTRTAL